MGSPRMSKSRPPRERRLRCIVEHSATRGVQGAAFNSPIEQGSPKSRFEARQTLGNGRVIDTQYPRSGAQRSVMDEGDEVANMLPIERCCAILIGN
jgi:hypothetical protein